MPQRRFAFSRTPILLGTAGLLLGGGAVWRATSAPAKKYVPVHGVKNTAKAAPKTAHPSASQAKTGANVKPISTAKPLSNEQLWQRDVLKVIDAQCASCHISKSKGGVSLKGFRTADSIFKDAELWESVAQNVSSGAMPPEGHPQPTPEQRKAFVAWIESALSSGQCNIPDPGRVTMRRLNRAEYNNTIRDLFGIDFEPAADFPSDDVGYGFDNIGDVLSISPLHMEKYLDAAEKISEKVIVVPPRTTKRYETDALKGGGIQDGSKFLHTGGQVFAEHDFPRDGQYLVRVQAWAHQAGDEPARMTLKIADKDIETIDVKAIADKPEKYEAKITATAGKQKVAVAFINDFYDEKAPEGKRDRNLAIDSIEVVGPLDAPRVIPEAHKKLIFREPAADATPQQQDEIAKEILTRFTRRAWRRPAKEEEIGRLVRYVQMARKDGESFERGIQLAVQATLVSPHFLFLIELDEEPNNPKARRDLSENELATRLSYFLWSSAPDEKLVWWADKGALSKQENLLHNTRRLLKDPRARSLAENFAEQWLQLRLLDEVSPDPKSFPRFNDELKAAMKAESITFFANVVREDRSILEFLDADYSFINQRLAEHYGVPNVKGPEIRRVAFTGEAARQRGGLVTQASVLTITSNPTRTSPVKRGKWVLEQFWNSPPPPPPPDVADLPSEEVAAHLPLRKRLEEHRKNPACASCHARMDGIGFSLETYNAVGAWRTRDGRHALDTSGALADGTKFNGPNQLKTVLRARKDLFARSFSEKMLTYALGRGLTPADKCHVDIIVQQVKKENYKFSSLITAIVLSEPFRKKRGDESGIKN